eukprot:6201138-Pleurochrysis_carterae.AAC.3
MAFYEWTQSNTSPMRRACCGAGDPHSCRANSRTFSSLIEAGKRRTARRMAGCSRPITRRWKQTKTTRSSCMEEGFEGGEGSNILSMVCIAAPCRWGNYSMPSVVETLHAFGG